VAGEFARSIIAVTVADDVRVRNWCEFTFCIGGVPVATVWATYETYSRRRQRTAQRKHQRLDIQGLRMVAILTVFANHLFGWPAGGFIGVDVFFVISGFLITGNLLRAAEQKGTVSFRTFYWNRVRRIVPAATVVLVLTYLASMLVFLPFRAHEIGVDALFAFVFFANWHFAIQDTNYFTASDTVSPIQHYWSLSIEEQFYFVWPALIFVISLLIIRKAWTHTRRMQIAGGVMALIVVTSLAWAIYQTATSPAWAYFDTFSRVWELGVGALLATAVGLLARIGDRLKPILSWAGLLLIAASIFLIAPDSLGFPAPWALLPVAGAALVIAAGVGGAPKFQGFLSNPVSTYIGDISYSLYLVHWPVIVILRAVMDGGTYFYVVALASSFALAIASYHFVENPLRRVDRNSFLEADRRIREYDFRTERSSGFAALGALVLLTVSLVGFVQRPVGTVTTADVAVAADQSELSGADKALGPLQTELQGAINEALRATQWPPLDPSMESVISGGMVAPQDGPCSREEASVNLELCTWGESTAPVRVILAGDSVALGYANPLRDIALNSGGQIQVQNLAMGTCAFTNDLINTTALSPACAARKDWVVDTINAVKPNVVIISNMYAQYRLVGATEYLKPFEWAKSMHEMVDRFRSSTGKVVLLAPPPKGADIEDCFSKRSSTPADCLGKVGREWADMAKAERDLAPEIGGVWINSLPWFCNSGRMCPAFVESTPTKHDVTHMAPPYGTKISPVIKEAFSAAGVF
jgi:peptidoglycan/LPS O-acetylase OafA/YrhL